MDKNCLIGFIALSIVILGIVAMFLNYKAKFEKKSITLEKNDQQHEHKHIANEIRIKELEKKNGHELERIKQLEQEIKELKENLTPKNY